MENENKEINTNENEQGQKELSVQEQIDLAVAKKDKEWQEKFNTMAKSNRERYEREAEKSKMSAEEKIKADYEDRVKNLEDELNAQRKENKDRKISETILKNGLPAFYKNDTRLLNASEEDFDSVVKVVVNEHNDYMKSYTKKEVRSTSPNNGSNTSVDNSTRDSVLAKFGVKI